jgi:hypothetical protein
VCTSQQPTDGADSAAALAAAVTRDTDLEYLQAAEPTWSWRAEDRGYQADQLGGLMSDHGAYVERDDRTGSYTVTILAWTPGIGWTEPPGADEVEVIHHLARISDALEACRDWQAAQPIAGEVW